MPNPVGPSNYRGNEQMLTVPYGIRSSIRYGRCPVDRSPARFVSCRLLPVHSRPNVAGFSFERKRGNGQVGSRISTDMMFPQSCGYADEFVYNDTVSRSLNPLGKSPQETIELPDMVSGRTNNIFCYYPILLEHALCAEKIRL